MPLDAQGERRRRHLERLDDAIGRISADAQIATEVAVRSAFTRKLAGEFGAAFVPLQSAFDEMCRVSKPEHWSPDGVHLTPAGHQLVADAWLDAVRP